MAYSSFPLFILAVCPLHHLFIKTSLTFWLKTPTILMRKTIENRCLSFLFKSPWVFIPIIHRISRTQKVHVFDGTAYNKLFFYANNKKLLYLAMPVLLSHFQTITTTQRKRIASTNISNHILCSKTFFNTILFSILVEGFQRYQNNIGLNVLSYEKIV